MSDVKDKIMNHFKTGTTENYCEPRKSKMRKQSEDKIFKAIKDRIIRNIRNFFAEEEDH